MLLEERLTGVFMCLGSSLLTKLEAGVWAAPIRSHAENMLMSGKQLQRRDIYTIESRRNKARGPISSSSVVVQEVAQSSLEMGCSSTLVISSKPSGIMSGIPGSLANRWTWQPSPNNGCRMEIRCRGHGNYVLVTSVPVQEAKLTWHYQGRSGVGTTFQVSGR